MRRIRRIIAAVLVMVAVAVAWAPAAEAKRDYGYQVSEESMRTFSELMGVLRASCETPEENDGEKIDEVVDRIASANADDGDIARAIAEHWKAVYLDEGYELCIWRGLEDARELMVTRPDFGDRHAFVVLGYALKDGKMQKELIGRCRAAAAAAASYPDSWLICSGGATGPNNPENNSEASLMKQFLVFRCNIDRKRILTDTRALTTLDNAVNTFAIIRKQDIHTITIVTSDYHQKWGQVLYNAMAAIYRKKFGYEVRIVGNFCYDTEQETKNPRAGYRNALTQLGDMLGLR